MDPITGFLVQLALGAALSFLGQLFKKPSSQKPSGIRSSETSGGNAPLSFIMGRYGTAGHREYSGTWGSSGNTPNAYYTLIRSVSDIPVRGLVRTAIFGEWVTLGDVHHANGYPVLEYRKGGKDHLWIEFFDGTQTTPDAFMLAKFGSDPDRPWLSDMIGHGIAYARLTARFNRELFNAQPDPFFEIDGIEVDDPRGDDGQDNPIVHVHQVLSGIYYGDEWVWGLQDLPASRLPSANWHDQMDKCDVDIDLVAGGTEPRFRSGCEITVDQQPIEVIAEILETCMGRIAEIGGVYKVLVAEPDDPVVSFTDDDIVISAGQTFDPFPGLENTFNAIDATYVEPAEKWSLKQLPQLRDPDLEEDDDGRRLPADVEFTMVYSGTQAQRLMQALLLEDRRFRGHTQTMPPAWWEYEVLDAVEWTSARNGYADKTFLITMMDDLANANQFVGLKEQEPDDYEWDPETDERPIEVVPLVIARPMPQVTTGFSVAPYTVVDDAAAPRRPAIEVFWDADLDDVRAVRIQVRESWDDKDVIADVTIDYDRDDLTPSRVIANPAILPAKDYEVRAIYLPFSGRVTRWSNQDVDGTDGAWLTVTTPAVPDVTVTAQELIDAAAGQFALLGQIRSLIEGFRHLSSTVEAIDRENYFQRETRFDEVRVQFENLEASFTEIIDLQLGPGGAIGTKLESLYAALGGNSAQVNVRWDAEAGPDGYAARMLLQAAVDDGEFRAASQWMDVPIDPADPTMIGWAAGRFAWYTSDGTPIVAMDEDGRQASANGVISIDWVTGDFSITVP